jgi:mitogen-activated protein kinase 7
MFRDYHTILTMNRLFHVPTRWRLIRPLGQGAYGLVIQVQDEYTAEPVAIKCITRVFDKVILARRALREITLLRHFGGHENLTGYVTLNVRSERRHGSPMS